MLRRSELAGFCLRVSAAVALLLFASGATVTNAALTPLSPQPSAAAVQPGVSVVYHYGLFNEVSEVDALAGHGGEVGKPIPKLDMQTAGNVFDSGVRERVGLLIDGMLRFPAAGAWKMSVLSNDGVRVTLADKVVLEDPDVHADRVAGPVNLTVPSPGWYKLAITYFQKKHTSALRLMWEPPGSGAMVVVPAEAYGHLNPSK